MAVARPVLERDTPLPAGLVRDRLRIGPRRTGILARHRDRAVAGQPVRPVLEARFERLLDQQRAKARAVDKGFAADFLAAFEDYRFDMAAFAIDRKTTRLNSSH